MNDKYILLNESLKALKSSLNLIILKGTPGFGKTHNTLNFLNENKIDYKYVNSYSSPLAFYKLLFENKDKEVVVFDDLQNIDNSIIISMLKSACWSVLENNRVISWYTTSSNFEKLDIPESFELKAKIILIFNDEYRGFEPIINRGFCLDIDFNFKEKIEIFRSLNLDKEIIDYIELNCNDSTENLSIRTIVILSKLKIDGFDWKMFSKEMLRNKGDISLILDLLPNCHTVKDCCDKWREKTCKSERSFYRAYSKIN
jgi:hypothetical protein